MAQAALPIIPANSPLGAQSATTEPVIMRRPGAGWLSVRERCRITDERQ
jgi:hypothetical protein